MKTSVIVPTKDREADLRRFIPTLVAQTIRPHQLVVVDSGTVPDLHKTLRRLLRGTGIRLTYRRSAAGTSLQRNVGIDHAIGDIWFFFDDDLELEPTYIEETLKCFDLPTHPPVGGVMGTQTNAPRSPVWKEQLYRAFTLTHWTDADDPRLYTSGGVRYVRDPSRILRIPVGSTACIAFRRQCFADGIRFAEFLPGYTVNEDVELTHRVNQKWTLLQTPHARTLHHVSPVARGSVADRLSRVVYAKFWFVKEHRTPSLHTIGALAWANIGLVAFNLAHPRGSIARARGLVEGYQRVVTATGNPAGQTPER